jgi:hypothetical protein
VCSALGVGQGSLCQQQLLRLAGLPEDGIPIGKGQYHLGDIKVDMSHVHIHVTRSQSIHGRS